MANLRTGVLALENGAVFRGLPFGHKTTVTGEAVFNTSMTGYQELLTDPSSSGHILTMTSPEIGNYGVNREDEESASPKISGLVVRELSPVASSWRSKQSLEDYLLEHKIPALQEIDTRSVTKILRDHGTMRACISTENLSDEEAVERARKGSKLSEIDYVSQVTCCEPYQWDPSGEESRPFSVEGTNLNRLPKVEKHFQLVAFDLGARRSLFRNLRISGFDLTVVPAKTSFEEVKELNPDGIFLSNGPGDPSIIQEIHKTVAKLLEEFPILGVSLGHQIIAHALGAESFRLKFGHRGTNIPVKNLETDLVSITTQNHSFAIEPKSLERSGAIVTEINLNDQSVEGLRHQSLPVVGIQYHPTTTPGPKGSDSVFIAFHKLIERRKAGKI